MRFIGAKMRLGICDWFAMTVILDIEGTVCPITFVKDTLFPYFLQQLDQLLSSLRFPLDKAAGEATGEADPVASICLQFPPHVQQDETALGTYIRQLVASDTKDPVLKSLQGLVWKKGYDNGDLVAPIYDDAIALITTSSEPVYIYSSGSVAAQKLLFLHVKGNLDLTPHIAGYFDITTSGHKQDSASYRSILHAIGNPPPPTVTFYSDSPAEVRAAIEAGMKATIVVRPGNGPLTDQDRQLGTITSFP